MSFTHFLPRALNKFRLLPFFNSRREIRVNQKKFFIPLIGRQGFDNLYLPEPWMTEVLLRLRPVFQGGFVDVGVNLGQTLLKAYAVFEDLQYIGFEPNPACVNYVQELVRLNGMKNIMLLPIAVGAKTEMLKLNFFTADKSDSSASVIDNFRPNARTDHFIFVPVFDFRQVVQFLPAKPFSILKIDVEGAEMEVLMGLTEWINTHQPLIVIEILPVYSADNLSRLERQNKIEEMLRSWNYRIARIKKENGVRLEWVEKIGIHSIIEDCDYLLIPVSLTDKITSCFELL